MSSLGLSSMWTRGTGRAATCCCSPTPGGQVSCDHRVLCDTVVDNWRIEKLKLRHQYECDWQSIVIIALVFGIQK